MLVPRASDMIGEQLGSLGILGFAERYMVKEVCETTETDF